MKLENTSQLLSIKKDMFTKLKDLTIKVTNWCDFCDISLFTSPRFPYMFRDLTSPLSGESSAAVYVLPLGSYSALLFVCVRLLCGLVRCGDYRHYNEPVRTTRTKW